MSISSHQAGFLGLSAAALLGLSSVASASLAHPGTFVGTTVTYSDIAEASGNLAEDPEPLYGPPVSITGDLLDFDPTANFVADAPPTDTTDGALGFTLTSNAGLLSTLVVSESGTFTFTGIDNDELVAATLQVQVLDTLTNAVLTEQQVVFTEQFDTAPSETGTWSNTITIDLTPFNASAVDVVIDNVLQATGVGQGIAVIRKSDFNVNTPEPAMASLLTGLGAVMLRRRRVGSAS